MRNRINVLGLIVLAAVMATAWWLGLPEPAPGPEAEAGVTQPAPVLLTPAALGNWGYAGDQPITDLSSATALTPPARAQVALIQAQGQNLRVRGGETDPTASVGLQLPAGDILTWDIKPLSGLKLIEEASGGKAFVVYGK